MLKVLHLRRIQDQGTDADHSNSSLVLRLVYGRSSILLAAELELESVLRTDQRGPIEFITDGGLRPNETRGGACVRAWLTSVLC